MAGLGNLKNYLRKHPVAAVRADTALLPLIERFDPQRHPDANAEAMRERILDELARRWASPGEIDNLGNLTEEALHARAIRGVDFLDANRIGTHGSPKGISLFEIVNRVIYILNARAADRSDLTAIAILAIGCRLHDINSNYCDPSNIPASIGLPACHFVGRTSFSDITVNGDVILNDSYCDDCFWLHYILINGTMSLEDMIFDRYIWLWHAIIGCDGSLNGTIVHGDINLDNVLVDGELSLIGLSNSSNLSLRSTISCSVLLDWAGVVGNVSLNSTSVVGGVGLTRTRIGGNLSLIRAGLGGRLLLDRASVVGHVSFDEAIVAGDVELDRTSIGSDLSLRSMRIDGRVSADETSVAGAAQFDKASIAGDMSYQKAAFAGKVTMHALMLSGAKLAGPDGLHAASWHRTNKDTARFGHWPPAGLVQTIHRSWAASRLANIRRALCRWDRDWLLKPPSDLRVRGTTAFNRAIWTSIERSACRDAHWGKVRAFGELAILSRASNAALIGVPALAALWPTLRDLVQWVVQRQGQLAQSPLGLSAGVPAPARTPHQAYLDANLPWVWGALFFAALLAVIGRVLYQAHCPQLIKQHSREDLITKRKDEFQRLRESDAAAQASAGKDGLPDEAKVHLSILEDSLKLVQEAGTDARLSAFRHPNLVRVNGRTYWLPQAVDDFAYRPTEIDDPKVVAKKRVRDRLSEVFPERFKKDEPPIEVKKVLTAPAWIPRTRREVIAVMAGADAEYDIEARRRLGYAYLSRWCYVLATVLIGVVLWFQGSIIFWEMGAGRTSGWESDLHRRLYWAGTRGLYDALLVAIGLIILWLLIDMVFGRDPLPHSDTIRWRIHRDLRKKLGKDHYRRK